MHISPNSSNVAAGNYPLQMLSGGRTGHVHHHDHDHQRPDFQSQRSPQDVVESQVNRSVRAALRGDGVRMKNHGDAGNSDDQSPEATAQRILDFVKKGLEGASTDEEKADRLAKAKEGIEKGFADAREVLDKMGLLQGDTAANIDQTYNKVTEGLDRIANPSAAVAPASGTALFSTGRVETGSLKLAIETADGDKINVEISHEEGVGAIARGGADGSISGEAMSYSASGLKLKIEGDVDEDEMKAITGLFDGVNQLASKFFQGDLEGAFQQAQDLGFDSEQLSGLSLELQHTSVRQEVAAYQAFDAPEDSPAQTAYRSPVGDAVSATGDLRNTFQAAHDSGVFAQPGNSLEEMFAAISELQAPDGQADAFLSRIKALLATVSGKTENAPADGTAQPDDKSLKPAETPALDQAA